ncbi:MAG: hypothetical protein A2Y93_13515 [Chloroflexi bacterium RBG_13_68_17]|jgi:uncharacterized protein|nr:MAG: hypothetical protein A2Y93_13515 [Chloroflexi bacterium RBG_13_68_17]
MRSFKLHDGKHGAALTIRVTPRARKNALGGILEDGTLRVRVAAPPVGGKANAALIEFLAEVLGVRKNKIEVVAGKRGLDKIVSIVGVTSVQAEERIRDWLQEHEEETG